MSKNHFGLTKLGVVTVLLLLILLLGASADEREHGIASAEAALVAKTFSGQWSALLQHADLVVRGQVVSTHSAWNGAHTLIETDNLVDVHYGLLNETPQYLTVRTLGGLLTHEDLGMASSEIGSLAPATEVLLFLVKEGDHYQIIGGDTGVYIIQDGIAVEGSRSRQITVHSLIQSLAQLITQQGGRVHLPANWQNFEATISARSQETEQSFVYKGYKWPGASPVVKYKINVNSDQAGRTNGSVADFRNAIIAAADTWNQVTGIDFKFQYDGETTTTSVGAKTPGLNGINEVVFMHQGITNTAGLGIYFFRKSDNTIIEADMWLNDDFPWDATGSPDANELDLQSGALHEFGHFLNLGHASEPTAIMFAYLDNGTLKRSLSLEDVAGIRFIYPCASINCVAVTAQTATSTNEAPTLTPQPTFTPTATSTPLPHLNLYLPVVTK